MAIGGHQSATARSETWLTPPHILKALSQFDLDPCAAEEQPTWAAPRYFTERVDGLSQPWDGRVWMNPPYGRKVAFWLRRLADHGNGIALVFARTETAMFFENVWPKAHALLFVAGRLHFHFPNGRRAPTNSGAPSVLIAYGDNNAEALQRSGLNGAFVRLIS